MASNDETMSIQRWNNSEIEDSYETQLRESLRNNSNDGRVWYQLGSHLRSLRRDSEAEQALLLAVLLKPNNRRAWSELALLYEYSGDRYNANLAWDAVDIIATGLDTSLLLGGIFRDDNRG
jgi:cytochrome c-type biogenesis protein CcmH/NrfG